jgi:hypothetical protein
VRARSLDLLLREHPSEIPLALLIDLAATGTMGAADRYPVLQQLTALAKPAASRIVARVTAEDVDTERRWHYLQLVSELPDSAAMPALLQLSARAPQSRLRFVAAQQLLARGQKEAGHAALATIAIDAAEWLLREQALYILAQDLPATEPLFLSILDRTRYKETYALARELLQLHHPSPLVRANRTFDTLAFLWDAWVARLPLGWLDRLVLRLSRRRPP